MAKRDDSYEQRLEEAKSESVLQLLFQAARTLNEIALARVASMPRRPSLRPSHTSVLPHLDLKGTRVTDLAQRVGVTKQAVSELVLELEEMGLVKRVADPDDGRAKRVVFTRKGRAGLLDGLETLHVLEADLERRLKPGTMASLKRTLRAVLEEVPRLAGEFSDKRAH